MISSVAGGEKYKMKDLLKKIKQFRQERDWDQYHSPKNLVMALSVEVAELVEHFQWLTQEESRHLPDDKLNQVRDEFGNHALVGHYVCCFSRL